MDTLARADARRGAGGFRAVPARARLARRLRGLRHMMRASHTQPGFLAALLHRLSGVALAIFLPLHFLALEFLDVRERTVVVLSGCAAAVFAVGLVFLLNAG